MSYTIDPYDAEFVIEGQEHRCKLPDPGQFQSGTVVRCTSCSRRWKKILTQGMIGSSEMGHGWEAMT